MGHYVALWCMWHCGEIHVASSLGPWDWGAIWLGSTVLGSMGQLVDVNEHGAGPGCVIPQVESRGKAPKSLAALRYLKPENS